MKKREPPLSVRNCKLVIFGIISRVHDIKDKFMRWFTVLLIAVIVIGGTVMVYPSYVRGRALKLQESELNEQILAKKREIASLMEIFSM